jgi:cytochrome c oxidase assembly factor CtaG
MKGWQQLLTTGWDPKPSVLIGCALVMAAYLFATRGALTRKTLYFALGVFSVLIVLVSPIDALGDDYLFSAHMVQHIFLDMVAPLLFVLGAPAAIAGWLEKNKFLAAAERALGHPFPCFILGNFTLCIWHLPGLFDAALGNENIHIVQHITFLITGTMLWWPVFKPFPQGRLQPVPAMIYLALSAFINGVLGIILTIPTTLFYAGYAHPEDELGLLPLLRDQWKLDPVADQQLGGAIMWVVGSVIYLWVILVIFKGWFRAAGNTATAISTESKTHGA